VNLRQLLGETVLPPAEKAGARSALVGLRSKAKAPACTLSLSRVRALAVGVLLSVFAGSVGAVHFYEFVVDAQDEEGCGPLADEEGLVLFLAA